MRRRKPATDLIENAAAGASFGYEQHTLRACDCMQRRHCFAQAHFPTGDVMPVSSHVVRKPVCLIRVHIAVSPWLEWKGLWHGTQEAVLNPILRRKARHRVLHLDRDPPNFV